MRFVGLICLAAVAGLLAGCMDLGVTLPPAPDLATRTPGGISTPRPQGSGVASVTPAINVPRSLPEARVLHIVDGDTIQVSIGGRTQAVRYIGIDAPEDTREHEPFGPEATALNRMLVEGKTVRLEKDVSETDQFGRLLRYVYVGNTMVNAELVGAGLAESRDYPPDTRRQQALDALEREARAAKRGMWGAPLAATATTLPAGATCAACIKGNISASGERVYHFPGCPDYDKTGVNPAAGERTFSSEREAQAAGSRGGEKLSAAMIVAAIFPHSRRKG